MNDSMTCQNKYCPTEYDIVYQHYDDLLLIYKDMIEEAKRMSGFILSNDFIYFKPVFQDFFELFVSSIKVKENENDSNGLDIKDYSDEDYFSDS